MIFGYIRVSPNWPEPKQRKLLEKAGVSKILMDKHHGALIERERVKKLCRRGNTLAVAGLGRLGTGPDDLREQLADIFGRGAVVWDVLVKATIDTDKLDAMEAYGRARSDWLGERTLPGRKVAKERGKLGGRPKEPLELHEIAAKRIWFNMKIPTDQDAARQIGKSVSYCRGLWRKSGRPRRKEHLIAEMQAQSAKPVRKRKPKAR